MPRKRRLSSLSEYVIPKIDPNSRNAVEDSDFVRHVLVDFDELAVISSQVREQLVSDLVDIIRFARGGVKARRRGVSDKALVPADSSALRRSCLGTSGITCQTMA
jgi:hypothetical protein